MNKSFFFMSAVKNADTGELTKVRNEVEYRKALAEQVKAGYSTFDFVLFAVQFKENKWSRKFLGRFNTRREALDRAVELHDKGEALLGIPVGKLKYEKLISLDVIAYNTAELERIEYKSIPQTKEEYILKQARKISEELD